MWILKISMWSIVNAYGLFARMTTFRHELIFQGCNDNNFNVDDDEDKFEWKTYEFKYKPGDIDRHPPFALFHLPRLDWRLWFLPLRKYNKYNDQWIITFIKKLIKNERNCKVIGLLQYNPFKDTQGNAIKAVRVLQYEYRFTGDCIDDEFGAKKLGLSMDRLLWENGKWWSRRYLCCKYVDIITNDDIIKENELKQRKLIQRINDIVRRKKKMNNQQPESNNTQINNNDNLIQQESNENNYHRMNDNDDNNRPQNTRININNEHNKNNALRT